MIKKMSKKHCFKLGVTWVGFSKGFQNLEVPFYIIDEKLGLYWSLPNLFITEDKRQIFLEDVLSIPTEYEFEPFERVLVRNKNTQNWRGNLYLFKDYSSEYPHTHTCLWRSEWEYCIPYKGNEHLLGTTKDAE